MSRRASARNVVKPRIRVFHGRDIAMGPGKADLLDAIERSGTITAAARGLRLSYMRAWTMIRTMNRCFRRPLVVAAPGGARGGAATLTPMGRTVLALYRRMEAQSRGAFERSWRRLARALKA